MQIRVRLQSVQDAGNGARQVQFAAGDNPAAQPTGMPPVMFGGPISLTLDASQSREMGLDTNTVGTEYLLDFKPSPTLRV